MLAWQNGKLLNSISIGKSLGLSNHTINRYIDFLEGTFMVKRLQPFSFNAKTRTPANYLITPDSEKYPVGENIWVIGIKDFIIKVLPTL